jgi:type IV pilus assembly protein PilV
MMTMQNLSPTAPVGLRRQRGLTLIEVLVSMLVMALGLLGMAALQTTTLRYQMGSAERASIGVLLADFSERVRANVGASASGPSDNYLRSGTGFNWTKISGALTTTGPDCEAATVVCSPDQKALQDMDQWLAAVRAQLPKGGAIVSGSAGSGLAVTLAWFDKDFSGKPEQCGSDTTGFAKQTCCPTSLGTSNTSGVRCANFTVTP